MNMLIGSASWAHHRGRTFTRPSLPAGSTDGNGRSADRLGSSSTVRFVQSREPPSRGSKKDHRKRLSPLEPPELSTVSSLAPAHVPNRPRAVVVSAAMGAGHDGAAAEIGRRLVERGFDVEHVDFV